MNAADKAIEEIRTVRHRISAEYGHDITKYLASLNSEEKELSEKLKLGEKLLARRKAVIKKYPTSIGKPLALRERTKK